MVDALEVFICQSSLQHVCLKNKTWKIMDFKFQNGKKERKIICMSSCVYKKKAIKPK